MAQKNVLQYYLNSVQHIHVVHIVFGKHENLKNNELESIIVEEKRSSTTLSINC